jgi:O-antigen/teichoic acid export membrane protein
MRPSLTLEEQQPRQRRKMPPSRRGLVRRLSSAFAASGSGKWIASVVDQGLVSGTSFATSVIIGRLCSRDDLGVYALALAVVRFLSGIQGELVNSPYIVYGNRRQGRALATYTGSTLVHQLCLSALSVLALCVLGALLARGIGPADLAPAVWALAGVLPFLTLRDYIRQVSFSHFRLPTVLAIDGSIAVFQVGGMLLLGYFHLLTVSGAYVLAGASCALACLGWFLAGGQPLRIVPQEIVPDWRHNWSFSRWTLAGFLVGTTTPYFMPWILAWAHGEAATGMLAACTTLVNLASTYVAGMANVFSPRAARAFAHGGADDLRRVMRKTALLFAVTVGAFCLFIVATGDLSARLVYGDKYAGSGLVLAVLAGMALANSLGITAGNGLWAIGRPRANFSADVCALVVTWVVLLAAVRPLGVLGAALALFAGAVTGAVVRTWRLRRLLETVCHQPITEDA